MIRVRPQDRELHPAVVISNVEWCASPHTDNLNLLACSKKVPADGPKPHHVLLDKADGLDFLTCVDCRFFSIQPKAAILEFKGKVTPFRQRAIGRKINEILRLI